MSDEPKTAGGGVLGKAKRLAQRVGDYARSAEARGRLDVVKKRAAEVGRSATAGAKKLAEGTRMVASQAAVELSKSERIQVLKAKQDWGELRGVGIRGFRPLEFPFIVGMSIFLVFPIGLYLLSKHPLLGRNWRWWSAGTAWSVFFTLALIGLVQDLMGLDKPGVGLTPAPPDRARLTADYLPHRPGAVREYDNEVAVADGSLLRFRLREVDGAEGVIEVSRILTGGDQGGREIGVPTAGLVTTHEERRRIAGDFVEASRPPDSDPTGSVAWERVLKIDARKGEVWEQELGGGSRLRTTLVEFTVVGGKPCAVIARDVSLPASGGTPPIVAHQERKYAYGVGLVEETIRSRIGDGPERTTSRKRLLARPASSIGGERSRSPTVEDRLRLLEQAGSLWDAGDTEAAAKLYYSFRKTWGDRMPRFGDEEKRAYGPQLSLYYARMIARSLRLYRDDNKRYFGMLKIAQDDLDNAAENGISLPPGVARSVREARVAPIEEKSFRVGRGLGRGSITVELPRDRDAGIALKDVELTDSGSVEFTMTWFPERANEPAWRWSAYDGKGVVLDSGDVSYGRSIRGREPTRARMLLGPDLWKKVATIKVE